jgi:hypothetical protein
VIDPDKKKALDDLIGDAYDKKTTPESPESDETSDDKDKKCKCGCGLVCEECREKPENCSCE